MILSSHPLNEHFHKSGWRQTKTGWGKRGFEATLTSRKVEITTGAFHVVFYGHLTPDNFHTIMNAIGAGDIRNIIRLNDYVRVTIDQSLYLVEVTAITKRGIQVCMPDGTQRFVKWSNVDSKAEKTSSIIP